MKKVNHIQPALHVFDVYLTSIQIVDKQQSNFNIIVFLTKTWLSYNVYYNEF